MVFLWWIEWILRFTWFVKFLSPTNLTKAHTWDKFYRIRTRFGVIPAADMAIPLDHQSLKMDYPRTKSSWLKYCIATVLGIFAISVVTCSITYYSITVSNLEWRIQRLENEKDAFRLSMEEFVHTLINKQVCYCMWLKLNHKTILKVLNFRFGSDFCWTVTELVVNSKPWKKMDVYHHAITYYNIINHNETILSLVIFYFIKIMF